MRTEQDSLGKIKVPKKSYYGATTARAMANFQISGLNAPSVFREALGLVKLAACKSNAKLKQLTQKNSKAIQKACLELIDGKFNSEFTLDVFQAGAGTSYNMNANEIIAHRANEILGVKDRTYKHVHPNNHVNMAQSTNDVIPNATRIAILFSIPALLHEINSTEKSLEKIAKKHSKTMKVGRTHHQDAVPISLGQEFDSYKEALKKSRQFIETQSQELQELGIGGTAVGTGINSHPKYRQTVTKELSKLVGIKLTSAKNLTEIANNMNAFLNFSATLRSLSINLLNICSDLKSMSSGPKAGLMEITLPPVQAGSSIMPGKINPSIPEATEMIAMQVIGNDKVIESACQRSNFELNVFCPIIMHNVLQSITILTNGLLMLRTLCIDGIKVNTKHIKETFDNSLCTATALVPKIGYEKTAKIVKNALKNGNTIREEALKTKLLTAKEFDKLA